MVRKRTEKKTSVITGKKLPNTLSILADAICPPPIQRAFLAQCGCHLLPALLFSHQTQPTLYLLQDAFAWIEKHIEEPDDSKTTVNTNRIRAKFPKLTENSFFIHL
jgi:hypothetical protein